MRINHNVMSLNSWRNLSVNEDNLSKSLEKLSSGFRINRAADDPAGLVISEKLRAEITGVNQAVNNTQDAVSMVQVAEGALVEINSMLNSMRALALHAANTGASSTDAIAADQQQIDSAVDSIASIANSTSYLGRYLLNGQSGNVATVLTNKVASVTVGSVAPASSTTFTATVSTIASGASAYGVGLATAGGTTVSGTLVINGISISLVTGTGSTTAASAINDAFIAAGMTNLQAANAGSLSALSITNTLVGSQNTINIVDTKGLFFSTLEAKMYKGADITGSINGEAATGLGLTLKAATGTTYEGTSVTVTTAANVAGSVGSVAQVTNNSIKFQIGTNGSEKQTVSLQNVNPDQLGVNAGTLTTSGLYDIKTGGNYTLAADAGSALTIVDAAISAISNTRATLGALQKNVLETKIRSLQVSNENLTASESRIRDLDMAAEMMTFTKSQILTQASTAMLAQANQAPQSILQLLK